MGAAATESRQTGFGVLVWEGRGGRSKKRVAMNRGLLLASRERFETMRKDWKMPWAGWRHQRPKRGSG